MIPLSRALESSIGRKFVMSISGIALVLFVIVHLLGNLTLLVPDGGVAFNKYAAAFEDLGPFLYVIEMGLLAVILIHIFWGVTVTLKNRAARKKAYKEGIKTKGGPSNMTLLSANMIFSGIFLGIFIVVHLWHFRVRKVTEAGKIYVEGQEMTNLYGLVVEAFQHPGWVAFYMAAGLVLGFHLRHGFWSAFQSVGAMKPEWSGAINAIGMFIAVLLAIGFLGIPLYLFLM